ncbi:GYG1 family protein [Megaselia abdita]
MQVQTFWDPMPADELKRVIAEHNASNKKPNGTIERIDKNTTVEYRDIEGGHEEITTTIMEDGTKSIKKKTFYDAKISDDSEPAPKHIQQQQNKNKAVQKKDVQSKAVVENQSRKAVLKKSDSTDSQSSHFEQKTVEDYRKVTQTSVKTSTRKNSVQSVEMVSSRKNSLVEEMQAIEAPKEKTKKKKNKGVPAPPPDFIENDSTVVTSRKVNGGTEYNYSTVLEDGRTVTTTKIVYEEEEVEMTEEDIQQYKKELKDAEKHKDITKAIKLKSPSGTKKVIPSEHPGEVTTVETLKFEGYTEFHYSTVCSDGVVKHSTKTVYDAVQSTEDDEEEIVEEIEEEIIEPGETIVKTFESTKLVEKNYAETVVTKKGKKTKKIVA